MALRLAMCTMRVLGVRIMRSLELYGDGFKLNVPYEDPNPNIFHNVCKDAPLEKD